MQVVEHEHERRAAADLGEQRGDRVEEAMALGVEHLVAAQRARARRRRGAELRQHDAEIGRARAEPRRQRLQRLPARPAAQHLGQRLIRRERLLVEAPVEHDRALLVRAIAQLGGEARLADPRVAGQQHDAPRAAARLLEQAVELADLRPAPDERLALGQRAKRRRPGVRLHRGRLRDGRGRLAAQQPLVDGHRRRAGHRPELLAQQRAQLLERAQRLGRVAGGLVDLHQQDVGRLAERRHRDGRAGGLLGGLEIAPALAQPGQGDRLQAAQADRVELAALLVQPRAVAVGQEARAVDARRRAAVGERRRPVAALERRLGRRRLGLGALDVDVHIGAERQLDPAAAAHHAVAEGPAQLRQQRAERRVGRRRRAFRPERIDQLGARADPVAVAHQVREEQAALAARDSLLQSAASERDSDRAAKPYLPATFYGH